MPKVNNWFSKYDVDRAEQMHYSVFKPSESKNKIDTHGSNAETSKKLNTQLPASTSDESKNIAKSIIIFDIKPWDDETDINAMEQAIRSIEADGLLWGQSKRVPVAYGINKLEIGCVIEDDKIGIDFLEEKIYEFDEYVQSVDIVSFNKI